MDLLSTSMERAEALNEEGNQLSEAGFHSESIEKYIEAIALNPNCDSYYYNIGLIYKYRGDWEQSFQFNQKAYALNAESESARWNLAIAATALRRWDIAREAWADNGLSLDGDEGPINMNFGICPLRLNPEGSGEVVWGSRLDPVRARIDSIPFRESGFSHGDIVLHDGAPVGTRTFEGREYSVFNVLEKFEETEYVTDVFEVTVTSQEQLDALFKVLAKHQVVFEDWTSNVRTICRQCSEGKPHEHDDEGLGDGGDFQCEREIAVAFREGVDIDGVFAEWGGDGS